MHLYDVLFETLNIVFYFKYLAGVYKDLLISSSKEVSLTISIEQELFWFIFSFYAYFLHKFTKTL